MKKKVLILGKLPPPYMGPSIATQIILNSELNDHFDLVHFNTKLNNNLNDLGSWSIGKFFRAIGMYSQLKKMVRKEQPDLVLIPISQTTMGFVKDAFYILKSIGEGRKVIVQLRGSDFKNWIDNSSGLVKSFVKKILNKTDGVIVLSARLKYLFADFYSDENIYEVSNGANYSIPNSGREKNGLTKFLYLANLQSTKGVEDVIEAAVILKEKYSKEYYLEVVGKWRAESTQKYCEELIEKHNLSIEVHPPKIDDAKWEAFAKTDVFIFTPRSPEGHPWVTVEAMAAGLPIIATDQGAICDFVHEGANGFIVDTFAPDQIAEKMNYFIENVEQINKFGAKSKEVYEGELTESVMVKNLKNTFDTVLGIV